MQQRTRDFTDCRPKLFGIAYRMLGSRTDTEDVLQDAYLRWHAADVSEIRSGEAWLVTIVTRLCLDRLRHAKIEREAYIGPWLPEPLVTAEPQTPEAAAELASDVSVAFMLVLERLSPEERAVFLLHQVFDLDYPDIAEMLGKTQPACRQIVHRARERVQQERRRFVVSKDVHLRLLDRFMAAAKSGDRAQLSALFADDATLTADAGGKAVSVTNILHGADRIARLFHVVARRAGPHMAFRHATINGEPGLLRFIDGQLDSAMSFMTDGNRITALFTVRNPDKLKAIPAELQLVSD
ncbi:RNA polymerase sigma-70 factor [Noviherbaspirillum saxi]|uniref:RNA polymerase sigma-70 factor n=1 Tax=Noviherbaspirillum saxi TaxID=2320863 RepID=A0A3A3FVJ1_9BURK|nr:RNA polymerase sigma-70 factor [Noviherbaspirillum saxi]RJF99344.1 RNA polymerase sigma-70 factor [Noviherbaspirillum saxi]